MHKSFESKMAISDFCFYFKSDGAVGEGLDQSEAVDWQLGLYCRATSAATTRPSYKHTDPVLGSYE